MTTPSKVKFYTLRDKADSRALLSLLLKEKVSKINGVPCVL